MMGIENAADKSIWGYANERRKLSNLKADKKLARILQLVQSQKSELNLKDYSLRFIVC